MGSLSAILGAQWGDEGKGKWVDKIAKNIDVVCRFQGGNNAGHTIHIGDQKHVLHLLPNGVFHPHVKIAISSGVVVDPLVLLKEIEDVSSHVELGKERLWLSPLCHIITPWHIHMDSLREEQTHNPIGTTRRGIGPTYADRALRQGLLVCDYIDSKRRKVWIEERRKRDKAFDSFYQKNGDIWGSFESRAESLKPYVCLTEENVKEALKQGQHVLCEGAQGMLLDLAHGSYPFVTGNPTHVGQAAVSLGLDPRRFDKIWGVAKVYTTRVGEGPFPTELSDEDGKKLQKVGNEFGATTKRSRRCGWFDAVAMRYAQEQNGYDGVYLTKLDVLSHFKTLKICTSYKHPQLGTLHSFPAQTDILNACTPVYESLPGWETEIPVQGKREELPKNAQNFLKRIEECSGIKILEIGSGVDREACITT